jgi:tetratricopeptide (TPR) repeat protein
MAVERASDGAGEVVALRADDPAFWLHQGHELLLRNRHHDAGACFDQALSSAPDDILALNARARTHLALGELEPALALLEQACELDDGIAELWNNRGVAQARSGDHQAALHSFAQALALDPTDSSVLCNRAMALVGAGEHVAALADLNAAVQLVPTSLAGWSSKGATHLRVGQLRLARHAFQHASRIAWRQGGPKRYAGALMILASSIGLVLRLQPTRS